MSGGMAEAVSAAQSDSAVPASGTVEITASSSSASPHGVDEFVERHAGGTFFHTSGWRARVVRHFPHRERLLVARRGERIVGVLPLFETRSPLTGPALVSIPYAVYGGPLAQDGATAAALLTRVRSMIADDGLRFAELRNAELDPALIAGGFAELPGSALYCAFVRELPRDPEECLAIIPRKSRASTRQARDRHRLEFREAPKAIDEFHRLFALNKQRLGSPTFAKEWFADLLALGRRQVRLHVVTKESTVVVAVISFLHGGTWNPYYSGSLPESDRLAASNFAYWQLMQCAAAEGFGRFDFGRSRAGTGPFQFKKNMGFEPTPLPYRFVLGAGQSAPEVNPGNQKFDLPRRVIQALPASFARVVGPLLMRLVP
ncbi:MAG: FemAB family PEP-CTERM system-associated protein [Planctomycetes bacterium]|nr:FemAB family PEP-CTERM system-associated protein [Planctomycetota bacterium]